MKDSSRAGRTNRGRSVSLRTLSLGCLGLLGGALDPSVCGTIRNTSYAPDPSIRALHHGLPALPRELAVNTQNACWPLTVHLPREAFPAVPGSQEGSVLEFTHIVFTTENLTSAPFPCHSAKIHVPRMDRDRTSSEEAGSCEDSLKLGSWETETEALYLAG